MTQTQRTLDNQLIARLGEVRTNWSLEEVRELFALPFADLLFHAQRVHRANFDPNEVQVSTLLSIKTGACPEDCAYCSQSIRFETGLKSEPLMTSKKSSPRRASRAPTVRRASAWVRHIAARSQSSSRRSPR